MVQVTFKKDFDFNPKALDGRVTLAFKAGGPVSVTTECKEAAIAAGAIDDDTVKSRKAD